MAVGQSVVARVMAKATGAVLGLERAPSLAVAESVLQRRKPYEWLVHRVRVALYHRHHFLPNSNPTRKVKTRRTKMGPRPEMLQLAALSETRVFFSRLQLHLMRNLTSLTTTTTTPGAACAFYYAFVVPLAWP